MKIITMTSLGGNGRLGNQLFQYAGMIGLSIKSGRELFLPPWQYAEYFEASFPEGSIPNLYCTEVKEPTYEYVKDWNGLNSDKQCVDILGFLQSEKYWMPYDGPIQKALTFKSEFVQRVINNFESNNDPINNAIAISIRRGDYVNNPNYAQLPIISYYFLALLENFPDWQKRQIIVFSDDIPYCRVHFGCLPNVTFSENNSDIEDICLMSQCTGFVIANSTFSWWGAYLAELQNPNVKIVRSVHHFDGKLKRQMDSKDLYPDRWIKFDCLQSNGQYKKLDLSDVTFTIPVAYDHEDRKENLHMCLRILQKNFNCEIDVMEQATENKNLKFDYLNDQFSHYHASRYYAFPTPKFHRTWMLNYMAQHANTKYIFNWDADVIIPPIQIWQAVQLLRQGSDMVYPYAWAFARMPRNVWFTRVRDYEDIGVVGDTRFNGMNVGDAVSLGGAVGFNRERFLHFGGENENFISYGAEDVERYERFKKLGARIERVEGENMYHMNHFVGPNSCPRHEDFANNDRELLKVKSLSKSELWEYVKTWKR